MHTSRILKDRSWRSLAPVVKKKAVGATCLCDDSGHIHDSSERAQLFADFLETSLWNPSGFTLPSILQDIKLLPDVEHLNSPFTSEDVARVLKKLKNGKSLKPTGAPREVFKTVASDPNWTGRSRSLGPNVSGSGHGPRSWIRKR